MADALFSTLAKYLAEPAKQFVKQWLCLNQFFKELQKEKEELISERDNLLDQVDQANQRTDEVEKPIKKWLAEVENLLKEVDELELIMTQESTCFQGYFNFPTWERYRLCRKLVKKIEAMKIFKGKSITQPFSHPIPLPGISYSSQTITYFRTTNVAIGKIMEALQNDDTFMIGVYGMGGVGKTTIATEVGKEAEKQGLFDKSIVIPITQNPSIRLIQGYMADMLGLELKEESEEGRSQRLWLGLKEKKRVLLIIDDIWNKRFNFEDIGIQMGNHDKGKVKIIVTTRDEGVCRSMNCQKTIQLNPLSEEESWQLFKKCAQIDEELSKVLKNLPQNICRECKNLPISIKAVGYSLKGIKSHAIWKDALKKLKHPNNVDDHVEGVEDVLNCLKLSYDFLPSNTDKDLFLMMCCMFPEDFIIHIEVLVRFAIGMKIGGTDSLDSARNTIEASINRLLDYGLLYCGGKRIVEETPKRLKVHDMFRMTGLWIAKKKNHNFFEIVCQKPITSQEKDIIKDCFGVTSFNYNEDVDNYLFQMHAPNLQILVLQGSFKLSPLLSFEGIQRLNVLELYQCWNQKTPLVLPQSITFLADLRSLCLRRWKLGDISCISSLTKLELLDLAGCTINEVPNDLYKLERLKLLGLEGCTYLEVNYNGAIGKCSQLEELYISRSQPKEFYSQIVADIINLPELKRFDISSQGFGDFDWHYRSMNQKESVYTRKLELVEFDISGLSPSKKNLFQLAEVVILKCVQGESKNIVPDMVEFVGPMSSLRNLLVEDCEQIECLFDTTFVSEEDLLVPDVVELELRSMHNLKELCRGTPRKILDFFENLKTAVIRECYNLKILFPPDCSLKNLTQLSIHDFSGESETLFSMSVFQSLEQLTVLSVRSCNELKYIISSEAEGGSSEIVPDSPSTMPKLELLEIYLCNKLETVFPICCVEGFPALECIIISKAPQLKLVFGEQDQQNHRSRLKSLRLDNLENLTDICLDDNRARWPFLTELCVNNCPNFRESWITKMTGCVEKENDFPIDVLLLAGFSELSMLYRIDPSAGHILNFKYLRWLQLGRCENLKSLFSMTVHRSLPELAYLAIYKCHELEQIIEENGEAVQLSNAEAVFPKLTRIAVNECNKLKTFFSIAMVKMLPQLSELHISNATQLEEIFSHGSEDDSIDELEIVLQNLKILYLNSLPKFVDVCKGLKLKAVNLEVAKIVDCPEATASLIDTQKGEYEHVVYHGEEHEATHLVI